MYRLANKVKLMSGLLRHAEWRVVWQMLRYWFHSDSIYYGLCRDVTQPFTASEAKIPITVRPLKPADIAGVFEPAVPPVDSAMYLVNEYNFYKAGIPTCYTAVTADDHPAYIQFLIGSQYNEQMQAYFRGLIPVLKPDEALLEYAYTLEAYRGLRIMSRAMALIAEQAPAAGAQRVITFVEHDNIASLKGCRHAGFEPYIIREVHWRWFRRKVTFHDLNEGPPYPLDMPEKTAVQ